MKKGITKEQWNELSEDQRNQLGEFTSELDKEIAHHRITIGRMIEFLGKEVGIIQHLNNGDWSMTYAPHYKMYTEKELVDVLWLLVKEELNG